jgi:hypothetical protein
VVFRWWFAFVGSINMVAVMEGVGSNCIAGSWLAFAWYQGSDGCKYSNVDLTDYKVQRCGQF